MATPNPHRGEVAIALIDTREGRHPVEFVMRPTFEAIAAIESETDKSLLRLLHALHERDLKLSDAVCVVFHGVHAFDSRAQRKIIGQMVFAAGIPSCVAPISEFLINALNGGQAPKDDDSSEENPTGEAEPGSPTPSAA